MYWQNNSLVMLKINKKFLKLHNILYQSKFFVMQKQNTRYIPNNISDYEPNKINFDDLLLKLSNILIAGILIIKYVIIYR